MNYQQSSHRYADAHSAWYARRHGPAGRRAGAPGHPACALRYARLHAQRPGHQQAGLCDAQTGTQAAPQAPAQHFTHRTDPDRRDPLFFRVPLFLRKKADLAGQGLYENYIYYFEISRVRFEVPAAATRALVSGIPYRVYYVLPDQLLSMEPLTAPAR